MTGAHKTENRTITIREREDTMLYPVPIMPNITAVDMLLENPQDYFKATQPTSNVLVCTADISQTLNYEFTSTSTHCLLINK